MSHFLQKVAYKLRRWRNAFVFAIGADNWLLKQRAGGRILVYHGLANVPHHGNSKFISTAQFEEQAAYFATHFHVVSLANFLAGERHPSKFTLALTFDDGYATCKELLLPILEKYNLPATLFVTAAPSIGYQYLWPDFLDGALHQGPERVKLDGLNFVKTSNGYFNQEGTRLQDYLKQNDYSKFEAFRSQLSVEQRWMSDPHSEAYWKLLDATSIQELAKSPLISIGAHGLLHANFGTVDRWWAYEEMKACHEWLELITGIAPQHFAFPFGEFTPDNCTDALQLGYAHVFGLHVEHPIKTNSLHARMGNNPYLSFKDQMASFLEGRY